jgi:predicted lysophospholipase L1 biosynthesis ABC-type transport system permease subunit
VRGRIRSRCEGSLGLFQFANSLTSDVLRRLRNTPPQHRGLFVVLLLVGNGIADSVQERTAELAVLSTLGFSDGRIRGLVFAEAFIPCLVGAIAGTAGAPLLTAVPRRLLPPGVGGEPAPTLWIAAVAMAVACAFLIAIAGATIPMLRLSRLNVAFASAVFPRCGLGGDPRSARRALPAIRAARLPVGEALRTV